MLSFVTRFWRANVPQLYVTWTATRPRRSRAIDDLSGRSPRLRHLLFNDFNKYGRTWQVLMSAEPAYRKRPDSIGGSTCAPRRRYGLLSRSPTYASGRGPHSRLRLASTTLPAVKVTAKARTGVSRASADPGPWNKQCADESGPPDFRLRLGRGLVPG